MSDETRSASGAVSLPDNPNLDWLRKQAKRRLDELRAANPLAKLADAQFDLAKRYGFTSWRALKAHIDALSTNGRLFQAARNGDPLSKTIPRLVGSLTNHLRRARQAHRLEAAGVSSADAAAKLGIKPFPAQKLYMQVRNFSSGELDAALIRLAALDHALKGGSRLANELELERALVEITGPQAA